MIKLYEGDWHRKSKDEALIHASNYTGFAKEDFKCEMIKEPKKIGLFKKKKGFIIAGMNMKAWMQIRN